MRFLYLAILVSTLFYSCKKDPGKGGSSSITGDILTVEYNKHTKEFVRLYQAVEEEVYIVYGDDGFYGDRMKTDNTGRFEFKHLTKGDYKVYAYSDNLDDYNVKTTAGDNINVGSNGSSVNIPTIKIIKIVETGNASASGKLFALNYNSDLTFFKDSFYLADDYVYIAVKGDSTYFDKIKSFYDGSYSFSGLLPGDYEVYAYSKAYFGTSIIDVPVKKEFEITDYNQNVILPRIDVIK